MIDYESIYLYIAQMRRIKKNRNAKIKVFEIFFFFVYHFDEILSGSSKRSSKFFVGLVFPLVAFGFVVLEDFVDASLKISSE
jgi:hypothetical protein